MKTIRLARAAKLLLLDISTGSRTSTARWRAFVPLANKGLVVIEDDCPGFSQLFGASYRSIRLTDAGHEVVSALESDASLWQPTANAHAIRTERESHSRNGGRPCICAPCLVARRMRPRTE